RFAPLHYHDFVAIVTAVLDRMPDGAHVLELCGPQVLDGASLARTLARKYRALPVPLWYPALDALLAGSHLLGLSVVAPDPRARRAARPLPASGARRPSSRSGGGAPASGGSRASARQPR